MQFVGIGRMMGPRGGGTTAFDPASLFASGEEGVWYDPSDLSTMFTDDAATTPVTADGDPVAVILDKSGNGYHARQTTAAKRPLYKTDGTLHWLQPDGVDDRLSVDTLSITPGAGTATWTQAYGLNTNSDTAYILLGDDAAGAWALAAADGDGSTVLTSGGTLVSLTKDGVDLTIAGMTRDGVHAAFDGAPHVMRSVFTAASGGSWTSPRIFSFFSGGFLYSGHAHSIILINRALTADEKAAVDTYVAARSGVTL